MKKVLFLLFIIAIFSSCNLFEKHYHDGCYILSSDLISGKIYFDFDGNALTIDNQNTGLLSKVKCIQYKDRIEIMENNGGSTVYNVLKNGNIRCSNGVFLLKICNKEEKSNEEVFSFRKIWKRLTTNNEKSNEKVISDTVDNKRIDISIKQVDQKTNKKGNSQSQAIEKSTNRESVRHDALIKDIISKDGEIYIVLDYIQIIDDYGAYKNESPKLRTFRLSQNCEIQNCRTDTKLTFDNIITYRNELISTKNSEHQIICYIKGDVITSLNFGCWG